MASRHQLFFVSLGKVGCRPYSHSSFLVVGNIINYSLIVPHEHFAIP